MIRTPVRSRREVSLALFVLAAAASLFAPGTASAQVPFLIGGNAGNAPGVWIEPDGTVKRREVDANAELATMRARAKAVADVAKNEKLGYVSLPKVFAAAKAAVDAGKPIPDEIKYLGGLTRIDFVFVYADTNDLVISGPAEPVHVIDELHAIGKRTGRPVMRMDDLVVALRIERGLNGGAFGVRLDPDPAAPGRISDVMSKMAKASRADRIKAVRDATGPQKVSFFGRIPEDSHFALATVAADYELKRYGLGLAKTTVADLGNIVDNTRQAVNMIWYELNYQPILVTPAGDAYQLRGPRLKVQAGSFNWDPKGATPKAFEFAKKMTKNIETLANTQPLLAELQNIADLSVVAALIRRDKLDQKVNWDMGWIVQQSSADAAGSFPIAKVPVPKNADALANYTNGAIASGGVVLTPAQVLSTPAEKEAAEKGKASPLDEARKKALELRNAAKGEAVVVAP